jgi:hypothetical protein
MKKIFFLFSIFPFIVSAGDILDEVSKDSRYLCAVADQSYDKVRKQHSAIKASEVKQLNQIKELETLVIALMDQDDSLNAKYGAKNLYALMHYNDWIALIRTKSESQLAIAEKLFGEVIYSCHDSYILAEAKYYLAEMSADNLLIAKRKDRYSFAERLYNEVIASAVGSDIANMAMLSLALLHASGKTSFGIESQAVANKEALNLINAVIDQNYSEDLVTKARIALKILNINPK